MSSENDTLTDHFENQYLSGNRISISNFYYLFIEQFNSLFAYNLYSYELAQSFNNFNWVCLCLFTNDNLH